MLQANYKEMVGFRFAAYIEKIWSRWPGFSVVVGKRNTPVERVEAVE